jgi:hypothetical protein
MARRPTELKRFAVRRSLPDTPVRSVYASTRRPRPPRQIGCGPHQRRGLGCWLGHPPRTPPPGHRYKNEREGERLATVSHAHPQLSDVLHCTPADWNSRAAATPVALKAGPEWITANVLADLARGVRSGHGAASGVAVCHSRPKHGRSRDCGCCSDEEVSENIGCGRPAS